MKLFCYLSVGVICGLSTFGQTPAWWIQNGVLVSGGAQSNDFSVLTVGQLKNMAKAAQGHLEDHLPDGAGAVINDMVASWQNNSSSAKDYSIATIGQLKEVSAPFYDRLASTYRSDNTLYDLKANLIAHGYPETWSYNTPWNPSLPGKDYSAATIGQLKLVFSFDVRSDYFYASPDGPTNGSSSTYPIQEAADQAGPGDFVIIRPGIYRGIVALENSGTPTAPITFVAAGDVTITGSTEWGYEKDESEGGPDDPQNPDWVREWNSAQGLPGVYFQDWPYLSQQSGEGAVLNLSLNDEQNWRYSDLISVDNRLLLLMDVSSPDQLKDWTFFIERDMADPLNNVIYIKVPSLPNHTGLEGRHIEAVIRYPEAENTIVRTLFGPKSSIEANYITLKGIHFQHAANHAQAGMVEARKGWKISECVFEGSNSVGLEVRGIGGPATDVEIEGSKFIRNGQNALGVNNAEGFKMTNCELSFNNWKGFSTAWEASNKFWECKNTTIKDCQSFWNCAVGLWFDTKNLGIHIEGCEIFGMFPLDKPLLMFEGVGCGVFIEVCYGDALVNTTITKNVIHSILGCGVGVSSSPDVKVISNTLAHNSSAYALRWDPNRGDNPQPPSLEWSVGEEKFASNKIYEQKDYPFALVGYYWAGGNDGVADKLSISGNSYNPSVPSERYAHGGTGAAPWLHYTTRSMLAGLPSLYDSGASSFSTPFDRVTVPVFAMNDPGKPSDEYSSDLLTSAAGDYILPIFKRGSISGSSVDVFDSSGDSIELNITSNRVKELLEKIPTEERPLNRAVHLRVHCENGQFRVVSDMLFSPRPVSPLNAPSNTHRSTVGSHGVAFSSNSIYDIGAGDELIAYFYPDPADPPRKVVIQLTSDEDVTSDERNYYYTTLFWGSQNEWETEYPAAGQANELETPPYYYYYMGEMPPANDSAHPGWRRLVVNVNNTNLPGGRVTEIQFFTGDSLFAMGGRGWWDATGLKKANETYISWIDEPGDVVSSILHHYPDDWHWSGYCVDSP